MTNPSFIAKMRETLKDPEKNIIDGLIEHKTRETYQDMFDRSQKIGEYFEKECKNVKEKILVVGHGIMFKAVMASGVGHECYLDSVHMKNCQAVPLLLKGKNRYSTHNFKKKPAKKSNKTKAIKK